MFPATGLWRLVRYAPALLALLVVFTVGEALARPPKAEPMFPDRGTTLEKDPYLNGSELTEGRLEGFRKLYVAETFADGLKPAKAPAGSVPAIGDLVISNPTSAWADIKVNGESVGRLGPFREGVVHDVRSGVYSVEFSLPNGRVFTSEAATVVPGSPTTGEG